MVASPVSGSMKVVRVRLRRNAGSPNGGADRAASECLERLVAAMVRGAQGNPDSSSLQDPLPVGSSRQRGLPLCVLREP